MGMRSSVSFRVVPGWTLSAISTPVTGEDRCDAAKQDKDKARPSCREELPTSGERAVHIPRSPQRAAPLCGKRTSLFSSSRQLQFTDDNPDQDQGRAQEYTGRQTFACNAAQYSGNDRSEEHTSELQSLMRNSYAAFCLKKKKEQPHL